MVGKSYFLTIVFNFYSLVMIINKQESNIQVIGDITEFKTSIDPKNLEFITTLLSSNLYSAPERSFIREIVSNAWDSQVEAGTTDIPIIIKITESENRNSYSRFTGYGDITIRDFGTGLSPERFNEVYRNIGSSTKRESNAYHGAFGIGHLSGFSCSNTMYITSYYNGTCYEYIGIKDADTIVYTLVSTSPTIEKNGLEVTLKNVYLPKYRNSLKYIWFFPNVFIEDNNTNYKSTSINDIKIKKYNNFWVSSVEVEDKLLLGNVLYPLNRTELKSRLDYHLYNFLKNIEYSGIVLKFDIGELSVTPNRESIIYTKEGVDKIINKILAVQKEIYNIIEKESKKDFTDLVQYTKLFKNSKCFDFFNETICPYKSSLYSIPGDQNLSITYKSKNLSEYINLLGLLVRIKYCSKWVVANNRVYNTDNNIPYRIEDCLNLDDLDKENIKILILKEDIKLGKYLRKYLIDTCNSNDCCIVIKPLDINLLKSYLSPSTFIGYNNKTDIDFILQELINYIQSKGTIVDFNNDADFIKYREESKKEAKLNKKNDTFKKEVTVTLYRSGYSSGDRRNFTNLNTAVEFLKRCHKGVVIINRDTPSNIKEIISKRGFLPIFVNKQVKELLRKYSFNVELSWVLHKDPYLDYYKTIIETINVNYTNERSLATKLLVLKSIISPNYFDIIDAIWAIHDSYVSSNIYGTYAKSVGKIDESLKTKVLEIKRFLSEYDKAVDILTYSGVYNDNYRYDNNYKSILAKILIKNKSFMINADTYKRIKHNQLINILCKK